MIKIAGIDPSINGTGKTIMTLNEKFDVVSVDFYGITKCVTRGYENGNVHVITYSPGYVKRPMLERQDEAYGLLDAGMDGVSYASFEDYAYGKAKRKQSGQIFQIAEFCGGLKRHYHLKGIGIVVYGIDQIKKFATGDGSAGKPMMCQALEECRPDLCPPCFKEWERLTKMKRYDSPHADKCDSFWMCEILRNHMKLEALGPDSLDSDTFAMLTFRSGKKNRCLVDYPVVPGFDAENRKAGSDSGLSTNIS